MERPRAEHAVVQRDDVTRHLTPPRVTDVKAGKRDDCLGLIPGSADRVGPDAGPEVHARQPHVPAARQIARAEDASGALELTGDVVQVRPASHEVFSNPVAVPE